MAQSSFCWSRQLAGLDAVRRRVLSVLSLRSEQDSEGGSTAFAKCATDARTAEWLLAEIALYESLKAPFLPAVIGADTSDPPLLVLVDLGHADWPPP